MKGREQIKPWVSGISEDKVSTNPIEVSLKDVKKKTCSNGRKIKSAFDKTQ